jgi:hypothetical protein
MESGNGLEGMKSEIITLSKDWMSYYKHPRSLLALMAEDCVDRADTDIIRELVYPVIKTREMGIDNKEAPIPAVRAAVEKYNGITS